MNYKGIKFDDITIDGYGVWSNVCPSCVNKYHIVKELFDGAGGLRDVCGVAGCGNVANLYIDFPIEEIKAYVWTYDEAAGIDAVVIAQVQNDEYLLTWHEGDREMDTMEELPYAKAVFQTWQEMLDIMETIASIHEWQVQDVK